VSANFRWTVRDWEVCVCLLRFGSVLFFSSWPKSICVL
jgi:hypothetical protein